MGWRNSLSRRLSQDPRFLEGVDPVAHTAQASMPDQLDSPAESHGHCPAENEPCDHGGRQHPIQPVHHTAVARQNIGHILDSEFALELRLHKIPQRGAHHQTQPKDYSTPPIPVDQKMVA